MVREIVVIKKPRNAPILDKPINFPPLQNLHLDLMENKKKLKKGLPPVQIVKVKPIPPPPPVVIPVAPEEDQENKEPDEEDDADMLEELGEQDEEPVEDDEISSPQGLGPGSTPTTPKVETPSTPAAPEEPEEEDPYAGLSPEERELKEKEEYIWRWRILKKQHKNRDIPSFNEHDDLNTMKTGYDRMVREIHLESSVESYRTYLIGGFMVMEYACVNWMSLDLTGFASQQMMMMDRYDRLLIELGERSYNRWGMNLPVEVRLIGFILLQAGLFYLAKIITDKAGSSMAELFKGITGQQSRSASQPAPTEEAEAPRRRMKGPSIKVADIRKMAEEEEE